MDQPHIELAGITIAAVDVTQMVQFYNAVFAADLRPSLRLGLHYIVDNWRDYSWFFVPTTFCKFRLRKIGSSLVLLCLI